MADKKRRLVSQPQQGLLTELGIQARLAWRLLGDPRVSPLLKILPVGALLYLVFPLDLIGPIDDALVLWLGGTLFIELAPVEVVEEHRAALEPVRRKQADQAQTAPDEDIIDADFRSQS